MNPILSWDGLPCIFMQSKKKTKSEGIVKGIVLAHVVLVLHLGLFAVLGVLVAFVSGVMQYIAWILLGGMALVALVAYLFYRRLRRQGKSFGDALRSPVFEGRSVEISFLGGMATLRLDSAKTKSALSNSSRPSALQLEDPDADRIRQINDLAKLLQKELITTEEFDRAKQRLLGPG